MQVPTAQLHPPGLVSLHPLLSSIAAPTKDASKLIVSKLGHPFEASILQRTVEHHGRLTAQSELCFCVNFVVASSSLNHYHEALGDAPESESVWRHNCSRETREELREGG